MVRSALQHVEVPAGFWDDADVRVALSRRSIADLFRIVQRATGATQSQIGFTTGLSQAQVSEIISGSRKVMSVDVLARIATGLAMPDCAATVLFLGRTGGGAHNDSAAKTGITPACLAQPSLAGVTSVYTSRSAFMSAVPIHTLFEGVHLLRASGLSLNLLCQHYSDTGLCAVVESGATIQALLLQPEGRAIRDREQEEGYPPGYLSTLNELNLNVLRKARERLPDDARANLQIGLYDATIRFNVILIDDRLCIAQPYLPGSRGVDSPTFVIEPQQSSHGLYDTFEQLFESAWESRQPQ